MWFKNFFPKRQIIFFGCDDFNSCFKGIDANFITKRDINEWISFESLRKIFLFLSKIRILSTLKEENTSGNYKIIVKRGLFFRIYFAQNLFFQNQYVILKIQKFPQLKKHLLDRAKAWLFEKGLNYNLFHLVFVHIRRGDYLKWPSKEFPAVMNLDWYLKKMKIIQNCLDNPVFILMGDDNRYLKDLFFDSNFQIVSDNPPEVDLAIMSLCHSGILSASSFAWWGAFYSNQKKLKGSMFIAPKYWAGHRKKIWYPSNIKNDWMIYF